MKIFDELKKLKKQDISAAELAVNIAAAAMLFFDKMFTCKWWDFLSATHLGARVTDTRGLSFFGVAEISYEFTFGTLAALLVFICGGLTAVNIILLAVCLNSGKAAAVLNGKPFAALPVLIFIAFISVLAAANIREPDYYAVREAYRELSPNAFFYIEAFLFLVSAFLTVLKRLTQQSRSEVQRALPR